MNLLSQNASWKQTTSSLSSAFDLHSEFANRQGPSGMCVSDQDKISLKGEGKANLPMQGEDLFGE